MQKFSLVYCLQEIIWSLIRRDTADTIPGYDVIQYAVLRYKQYHRNKYNILSMKII